MDAGRSATDGTSPSPSDGSSLLSGGRLGPEQGSPVDRPARSRRAGAERAVPERSSAFAHLGLDGLRTYRRALVAEERRVSYWRRLIQGRLDIVQRGAPATVDARAIAGLLQQVRNDATRRALVDVVPDDDMPPLPALGALWARDPSGDPDADARLGHDLATAEAQLSAYRRSLHRRLGAATTELIARYREDPTLCLSALPQPAGSKPGATPAAADPTLAGTPVPAQERGARAPARNGAPRPAVRA